MRAADTVIKLPARKFSVREREMLFGAGAPNEFFYEGKGSWVVPAGGFLAVVAAVVWVGMLRAKNKDEAYHRTVDEIVRRRSLDLGDGEDQGKLPPADDPPKLPPAQA